MYQLGNKRFIDVAQEMFYLPRTKDSKVFYVNSNHGKDSYGGQSRFSPFATIQAAYNACTASNYDTIVVEAEHTETITVVMTLNKIGVQIIGEKSGNLRPVLTGSGTIDVFSFTAANQTIQSLEFAAPAIDAQTADINIAAAKCSVLDTVHHGSFTSVNKVNIITITAAGDDCLIDGLTAYNTTVEVVGAILFEGAATNVKIRNTVILDTIGYTNGAIYDAAAATGVIIENCYFENKKAATAVVKFASNSVGMMNNVGIAGRHTTMASNMDPGTSMNLMNVKVCEEAIKTGMDYDVDAD